MGQRVSLDLIQILFKVDHWSQININYTEEEMFAEVEEQPYQNALYSLIN